MSYLIMFVRESQHSSEDNNIVISHKKCFFFWLHQSINLSELSKDIFKFENVKNVGRSTAF